MSTNSAHNSFTSIICLVGVFFVYLYYTLTVSDESKLKTFKPINDIGGRMPIDLIGFFI